MKLREFEHTSALKEKDLALQLERAREALSLKELELTQKVTGWERERKQLGEQGTVSRRLV